MELIKRIKHQLHDRMIEKRLSNKIQRKSIDFEMVKEVGIIFNGTELKDRQEVEAFKEKWQKLGKSIYLLCVFDSKEPQPNLTVDHFTKAQVNWLGKIQSEKVDSFIQEEFDLMISCSQEQVLNDIAAMSKSKLRVGPITEKDYCYDLMISRDQNKGAKQYLEQIERFLTKLKQGKHAKKTI